MATSSAGTLAPSLAVAQTGLSVTASAGTLGAATSFTLTGFAATSAESQFGLGESLTGLSAFTAQGTVVAIGGDIIVALSGQLTLSTFGAMVAVQQHTEPNPPINWPDTPANANRNPLDPTVEQQAEVTLSPAPPNTNRNPLQ